MQKEIKEMSFEDAMAELETVVRQLETGKIKLDEAVGVYERGVLLKKHCEEKLQQAKLKIDKLVINKDGSIAGTEEFTDDNNG